MRIRKRKHQKINLEGKHFGQARLQRKQRIRRVKIYLLAIGIAIFLAGLVYGVFNASFLHIKTFIVETSADANQEKLLADLRQKLAGTKTGSLFGTDHYFAWPSTISNPPLEFTDIAIEKSPTKSELTIKATSRAKFGLWCVQNSNSGPDFPISTCFWLDPTGILFKEGPMADGQLVPAIYEEKNEPVVPSFQPIIEPDQFEIIKSAITGIKTIGLSYQKIILDRANQEIEVVLSNGTKIFFSLRFDPAKSALPALAKLNREKSLSKMSYIDLTVENRAFYK